MEYIDINNKIAIISGFNNIGVIKNGKRTILIDSGLENRAAEQICRILEEKGLKPSYIINTHSHADHCGGNNYIQKNYDVEIISSRKESVFIENPCLEPICFFSGSRPINDLENKFLQAAPSKVNRIVRGGERISPGGVELNIVSIAGHSLDQIGIRYRDIVFCGDSFFSERVLEKYKLPFLIDLDKSYETLEFLKETEFERYIPSHGELTDDIEEIVDLNIAKMNQIENDIKALLVSEMTTEELLSALFSKYAIKIKSAQQYYLLNTTVMAYLSSLANRMVLRTCLKDNIISWKIN